MPIPPFVPLLTTCHAFFPYRPTNRFTLNAARPIPPFDLYTCSQLAPSATDLTLIAARPICVSQRAATSVVASVALRERKVLCSQSCRLKCQILFGGV